MTDLREGGGMATVRRWTWAMAGAAALVPLVLAALVAGTALDERQGDTVLVALLGVSFLVRFAVFGAMTAVMRRNNREPDGLTVALVLLCGGMALLGLGLGSLFVLAAWLRLGGPSAPPVVGWGLRLAVLASDVESTLAGVGVVVELRRLGLLAPRQEGRDG